MKQTKSHKDEENPQQAVFLMNKTVPSFVFGCVLNIYVMYMLMERMILIKDENFRFTMVNQLLDIQVLSLIFIFSYGKSTGNNHFEVG